MKAKKQKKGRRGPLATTALVGAGLILTGGAYAGISQVAQASESSSSSITITGDQSQIDEGANLFATNCASCHGVNLEGTSEGPSLIGVGAASVSFQVGTGRMPLTSQGAQAPTKTVQFTDEQIAALAAYVQANGGGPSIPDLTYLQGDGDAAHGAQLFRTNCAMCHNVAGAGGALTEGKYAPSLSSTSPEHIYEAMITGPQNMPVFSDANLSATDKQDIITYLLYLREHASSGGFSLGNLGPVAEGLFLWIFGLGTVVAFTIWLTSRPN